MIINDKKREILNTRINLLISQKDIFQKDIENVSLYPNMDPITIVKIQKQIDEINLKIEALEAVTID